MDPDDEIPAEGFGGRLKRLVRLRGFDNGTIARELGVHLVTVSRWMGGQEPKGATLLSLARLLNVSPDLLLTGPGPNVSKEHTAAATRDKPSRRTQPRLTSPDEDVSDDEGQA